uniref:Uncharacterized protein n=1 Tax=Rhizophora mucronata TaxID=61149 RepID=A0A2P2PM34_RHIMU
MNFKFKFSSTNYLIQVSKQLFRLEK